MKNLPLTQMSKAEPNPEPATADGSSIKLHHGDNKKIGSFMRRDKRKNAKPRESSDNGKTSSR